LSLIRIEKLRNHISQVLAFNAEKFQRAEAAAWNEAQRDCKILTSFRTAENSCIPA
jgi:hypothetical protein